MASKPAVAGLERRLAGQAVVVRVNIADAVGWEAARRYGATVTPTFIVLTPDGSVLYRASGFPDTGRLEAEARSAAR